MKLQYVFLGLIATSMLVVSGCKDERHTDVAGTMIVSQNGENSVATRVVKLEHTEEEAQPRVDYNPNGDAADLGQVRLNVTSAEGAPFSEEYVFFNVSRSASSTAPFEGTNVLGQPTWINQHFGNLVTLRLRRDDASQPEATFDDFPPSAFNVPGASWLARIEDGDRSISWIETEGLSIPITSSLVAPPAGQATDIFDMQTVASMFLAQLAVGMTEGMQDLPLNFVKGAVFNHRLYVIPHVSMPSESLIGFGLLYAADIRIRTAGLAIAEATVWIPLSILFGPDFDSTGLVFIDPLTFSFAEFTSSENLDRVTVTYDGLFGQVAADQIRSKTIDTLSSIDLKPVMVFGIALDVEEALGTLFTLAAQLPAELPANWSVIALPANASPGDFRTNLALVIPSVIMFEQTVPVSQSLPVGVTADASGKVIRVENIKNLSPDIVVQRTTAIDPVQTVNLFELQFLH